MSKLQGLANLLTISRLVASVVVFGLIFIAELPGNEIYYLVAAILFSVASITDLLDGIAARYLEDQSELGAFLDPVADKVLVIVGGILAVYLWPYIWMVSFITLMICRELAITVLRDWSSRRGLENLVEVSFIAKINTIIKLTGLCLVLFAAYPELFIRPIILALGVIGLMIAILSSYISFVLYLRKTTKQMFPQSKTSSDKKEPEKAISSVTKTAEPKSTNENAAQPNLIL